MNYALLVLSFLLCGIGLTLVFVFFEPIGFVLDGLGFMLFLYVLHTRNKEETLASWKEPAEETNKCVNCALFGMEFCPRHEVLLNATPCNKFSYRRK